MAYGFREKLRRAEERAAAVERACTAWVGAKVVRHDPDVATGYRIVKVWMPSPPEDLEPSISEFAHASRACLDNLVFALAERAGSAFGPKQRRDSQFPIFTTQPIPKNELDRRIGCLPASATQIIEDLQPTGDPANTWLADLHALNIGDKHHLGFTATARTTGLGIGGLVDATKIGQLTTQTRAADESGSVELARYTGSWSRIGDFTQDRVPILVDLDVVFAGGPLDAKQVTPTVRAIAGNLRDSVVAPLVKFL